ncbi:MAG: type V CRISPR-associated endonuclease Cas1 [Bacteroidales bacterium]|nr:type V CRISPR-associated endonuclease Cas1 [Bacteroidales bacterium]
MFTHKDIECRTIFVINCMEKRNLRVSNGELLLEEVKEDGNVTLTKMPFQKILMLFIVGHITITTPLIEKCKKFNVALVVVNFNLRPVFYWADSAEANYILRKKQYSLDKNDISIAKILVKNKIENQIGLLKKTRMKDELTVETISSLSRIHNIIDLQDDYNKLMGIEGLVSKKFFSAYYQKNNWIARRPRVKCDPINSTLDIGYTILFNYIECFVRMFGFDIYAGVYHRLWFKRKSLICDLMEPFRCVIDNAVRTAFNKKQCSEKDFKNEKGEWRLKYEKNKDYTKLFYDALMPYKTEVFKYIQSYYRCFMQSKPVECYPNFKMK